MTSMSVEVFRIMFLGAIPLLIIVGISILW
nr:MAG TPA: hypothetical protein [Caudoviricetes sp.]